MVDLALGCVGWSLGRPRERQMKTNIFFHTKLKKNTFVMQAEKKSLDSLPKKKKCNSVPSTQNYNTI